MFDALNAFDQFDVFNAPHKTSFNGMQAKHLIGQPGTAGFGQAAYYGTLPAGFSALVGSDTETSEHYGNYQFSDGSIMCWIPAFYYRIGHSSNPTYADYGANSVDVQAITAYSDTAAANADGYALHRAFINAGAEQRGFFYDKYQCSNNSGTASSLKDGNPLSSNSAHNPFSGLTGSPANAYYGAFAAAKTRGSPFHVSSRFQFAALALLALAHAQAATSTTYCAWYDAAGSTNYPKGCNNNALSDTNDSAVKWQSDGYSACGKTGSAGYGGGTGNVFAKSTHNGQDCGVADLNGNMWEINSGMTRPGSTVSDVAQQNDATAFYILKESADVNTLTGGWNDATDAFGDATHLSTLYDAITLNHIGNGAGWQRFGNSASPTNAVLDNATAGDGYRQTVTGIYTADGHNSTGINLFGADGLYEYHRANLCLLSGGPWIGTSTAGVWALYLSHYRTASDGHVGFRSAAYV
jgi:hypothetical protein